MGVYFVLATIVSREESAERSTRVGGSRSHCVGSHDKFAGKLAQAEEMCPEEGKTWVNAFNAG